MLNARGGRCRIMYLYDVYAVTLLHAHGWHFGPISQLVL